MPSGVSSPRSGQGVAVSTKVGVVVGVLVSEGKGEDTSVLVSVDSVITVGTVEDWPKPPHRVMNCQATMIPRPSSTMPHTHYLFPRFFHAIFQRNREGRRVRPHLALRNTPHISDTRSSGKTLPGALIRWLPLVWHGYSSSTQQDRLMQSPGLIFAPGMGKFYISLSSLLSLTNTSLVL